MADKAEQSKIVYSFIIYRAETLNEAIAMFKEGKDPVMLQEDKHEVCVFTKVGGPVARRIYIGANWHMSEGLGEERCEVFTFTRLNFEQVLEYLSDPTKFNLEET